MAKRKQTIEQIETSLARWQTRLKRAMTAIERLQKQRKRMLAKKPKPLAVTLLKQMAAEGAAESAERPTAPPPPPTTQIDTSIPDFLRHSKDTPEAEAIRAEQADRKRRKNAGRVATMKAKASGETKKMPLTGRAALAAIRAQA